MNRRDLILGAACLATAGSAYALVPRRKVSLLGGRSLEHIIPRSLAGWQSRDAQDLVGATEPGTLSDRLYKAMLTRIYRSTSEGDGSEIMAMMAWGPTQTNDLQVHRPEVCFPAFGFALSEDRAVAVNIAGARVPSREFIATSGTSVGYVLYWTRLGEFLPQDRQAQKLARMQTALQGAVADGILVRFETAGPAKAAAFARLEAFASALVAAMNPVDRAVLIGTRLAAATGAAQA